MLSTKEVPSVKHQDRINFTLFPAPVPSNLPQIYNVKKKDQKGDFKPSLLSLSSSKRKAWISSPKAESSYHSPFNFSLCQALLGAGEEQKFWSETLQPLKPSMGRLGVCLQVLPTLDFWGQGAVSAPSVG